MDYSPLVNEIKKVDLLRNEVYPIVRPKRAKLWPCLLYSPQGGTVTEALEGHGNVLNVNIEILGTTFENVNKIHDEVLLKTEKLLIGAPTIPFWRYDENIDDGIFTMEFEISVRI